MLSFSHPDELSAAMREHASRTYAGIAEVHNPAEAQEKYQISLKVRSHTLSQGLCNQKVIRISTAYVPMMGTRLAI